MLRDLQYLQASMIWLDIGVFCGYTRKMQIAESYLQPLCTVSKLILAGLNLEAYSMSGGTPWCSF